jgi:hypothetical protein
MPLYQLAENSEISVARPPECARFEKRAAKKPPFKSRTLRPSGWNLRKDTKRSLVRRAFECGDVNILHVHHRVQRRPSQVFGECDVVIGRRVLDARRLIVHRGEHCL